MELTTTLLVAGGWFVISLCLLVLVVFQRAENAKMEQRVRVLSKKLQELGCDVESEIPEQK